jgi:hypothetical protein
MQDLSNDLFKKIVSSLVERCVKTKYEYFKMPTIHNSFNGLVSKYSKLNEFMNSFSLSLAIKDTDYRVKGDFRMMAKNTGAITLRISYDDIRNSLVKYVKPSLGEDLTQEMVNEMVSNVYFNLFDNQILSTLLHELQHAYDSWRSNTKFTNSRRSNDFYSKYGNDNTFNKNKYDEYIKMQHEINARFSQAISDIKFFKLNFSDDETKPLRYRVLFPIDTVIADFKSTFMGYQAMAPSVQERLLNRLIKIYSQAEEKVKEYNDKL